MGQITTSEEMSCSKTGVQEIEKPDREESVDFDDPRDKDESKNVFNEKNVIASVNVRGRQRKVMRAVPYVLCRAPEHKGR